MIVMMIYIVVLVLLLGINCGEFVLGYIYVLYIEVIFFEGRIGLVFVNSYELYF